LYFKQNKNRTDPFCEILIAALC